MKIPYIYIYIYIQKRKTKFKSFPFTLPMPKQLQQGCKNVNILFLNNSGHFWCSVVTLVTFSSKQDNLKKNICHKKNISQKFKRKNKSIKNENKSIKYFKN